MGVDEAKKKSAAAKGILCTKEKIEKTQKKILKVVEMLLEDSVPPYVLIKSCENLSQADYSDVIEERNILTLCGYPLCSKKIQLSKQKYHISLKQKKVYDISERKCFCSNECYKASKFLKVQLSEEPVWLQEEPVTVALLSDSMNKGSAGEEVNIEVKRISKQDIQPEQNVVPYSHNSKTVLLDEIGECTSQLKNLVVKETGHSLENTHGKGLSLQAEYPSTSRNMVHSQKEYPCDLSKSESNDPESNYYDLETLDSDDDEEDFNDDRIFPRFENESLPVHKSMPAVSKPKFQTTVLIDPLPKKVQSPISVARNHVSLDFVQVVLQQWMTRKSLQFLYSKKNDESVTCVELGIDEYDDERIAKLQNEYVNLCVKLERQEAEENEVHDKFMKDQVGDDTSAASSLDNEIEKNENLTYKEKVAVYFKGDIATSEPSAQSSLKQKTSQKEEKRKPKPKTVTFTSDTKQESTEAVIQENESVPEPLLPLVDSLSQDTLRLQIVTERLRVVYLKLLPLVGLNYTNFSNDVTTLLSTFKFSANNITFRPNEWKVIALILFRMLMNESFIPCESLVFHELLEQSMLKGNLSVPEIDAVINTLKKNYQSASRIVNIK